MNATDVSPTRPVSFNRDPGMGTYALITLLVGYSIVCIAILSCNYLTLRAFMTTKPLLRRQRYFLGYMACVDLVVGLVSIPSFIYDLSHWPSQHGFLVYEASDCWTGFTSGFILTAISIQGVRSMFEPPTRYSSHPDVLNYYRVIAGSSMLPAGIAALYVGCLLGRVPFIYYFFVVAGLLAVSALVLLVTNLAVLVVLLYRESREGHRNEDKCITRAVMFASFVYIITWAAPFAFLAYNYSCSFCIPLSAKFLYIARVLMYFKSIIIPLIYFYKIPPFKYVVKRILTRDCFAR